MKKILIAFLTLTALSSQVFALSTKGKVTVAADAAGAYEGGKDGFALGTLVPGLGNAAGAIGGALVGGAICSAFSWWAQGKIIKIPTGGNSTIPDKNNPMDYVGAKHNEYIIGFASENIGKSFSISNFYNYIKQKEGLTTTISLDRVRAIALSGQENTGFDFLLNLEDENFTSSITGLVNTLNTSTSAAVMNKCILDITKLLGNSTVPESQKLSAFASLSVARYSVDLWSQD
jgi:hypothetical protein